MNRNRMNNNGVLSHIVIIGGGFSGTCLAAELLRGGNPSISVTLLEPAIPGRGVAYGTQCAGHLLNVPAQKMSARADDASHFLRWAQRHYDQKAQAGDFLPRRVYGRYVEFLLQEASEDPAARFEWRRDEATALATSEGKTEILLRSGGRILADKVVLALGNFPPANLRIPGITGASARYVSNPWLANALGDVKHDESVMLVGCGLTSVDVAISLRERGFQGEIHMLSRHGLLPQQHKTAQPWPTFCDGSSPRSARGLLRLIRTQVQHAEQQNGDWRAVIDSLRPVTQKIWQALPLEEQRRFLRHLRVYWDVHRHRVAPQIGAQMATEMNGGKLEVHAGRLIAYRENESSAEVTYRERGSGQARTLRVQRVINCTGPDSDLRRVNNPLLNDLIRRSLVRTDPLFLGLDTTDDGALIAADGAPSECLFTIGPLRKGNLWETTAVPEIRVLAAKLALRLTRRLEPPIIEKEHTAAAIL